MIDVTMAVRSRPFREWTIVTFDPKKTNEKTLLARLRTHGCKRASRDGLESTTLDPGTLTLQSRITVAGDVLLVSIDTPKGGSLTVTAPKGWTVSGGATQSLPAGSKTLAIQVPKDARQGVHPLAFQVDTRTLKRDVEIVQRVR